jgi:hypothetical protein
MAISSVLQKSTSKIIIGYINPSDLLDLPKDERITHLDLSQYLEKIHLVDERWSRAGKYVPFDNDDFFDLVRIKWVMFEEVLRNNEGLIYTDLDVIWLEDVHESFRSYFENNPEVYALVQDSSTQIEDTQLCMGLFACRSNDLTRVLLNTCAKLHEDGRSLGLRYSDDSAISDFYRVNKRSIGLQRLPQSLFPVGNMTNLFLPVSIFRGLRPNKPMVFHANYVVGVRRKLALLRLISLIYDRSIIKLIRFGVAYVLALTIALLKKFGYRD